VFKKSYLGEYLRNFALKTQTISKTLIAFRALFLEHIFKKKWALLKSLCRSSVHPSVRLSVCLLFHGMIRHGGTLSFRNFIMMVKKNHNFEPQCYIYLFIYSFDLIMRWSEFSTAVLNQQKRCKDPKSISFFFESLWTWIQPS
jgi:hypothetical protein